MKLPMMINIRLIILNVDITSRVKVELIMHE